MIVQCDQCSTKFRLDDSKVTPSGVKVRCAKCKHVFLVKKDSHEDVDLDQLLGKLDGSSDGSDATDLDSLLAQSPAPTPNPPPAAAVPPSASGKKSASEIRGVSLAPQPAAPPDDEDGFSIDDLLKSATGGAEEEPEPSAFGDLDFNTPSSTPPSDAGDADSGDDFGSFDLSNFSSGDESQVDNTQADNSQADNSYGDFDADSISFGDHAAEPQGGGDPEPENDFAASFGELPDGFSESSLQSSINNAFGTSEDDTSTDSGGAGGGLDFGTSWGSFSTDASDASDASTGDAGSGGSDELADLLGFSSPQAETDSFGETQEQESAPQEDSFGDFLISPPQPAAQGVQEEAAPPSFAFDPAPTPSFPKEEPKVFTPPPPPAEPESSSGSLAIVFPDMSERPSPSFSSMSSSSASFDGELPPLVISSRKKSGAPVGLILGIVAAVLVSLLGGGYFLWAKKPELLQQAGLGGAVVWLDTITNRGSIDIRNVQGKFVVHPEAGEIFVIRGEAVNTFRRSVEGMRVKGLLHRKGATVMQKEVFCGVSLTDDQLAAIPMAELDAALIKPQQTVNAGESRPFVIVFMGVPAEVDNFGVELAGGAPVP